MKRWSWGEANCQRFHPKGRLVPVLYYRDKYYRLKARRGGKRAALAIAHKILIVAYHVLNDGYRYRELGGGYLDSQHKARTSRHLVPAGGHWISRTGRALGSLNGRKERTTLSYKSTGEFIFPATFRSLAPRRR